MSEIYVFANIIDLKTPESCQVKADTDSEPRQTSKIKRSAKSSIFNVWQGSEYTHTKPLCTFLSD